MKKIINLNLNKSDEFFVKLKEYFLKEAYLAGYDISPNLDKVVVGTLKTLKSLAAEQNQKSIDNIKITYNDEEFINPDFYEQMEEDIDVALNHRVHSTTLERIVDSVVEFMNNYADMQAEAKIIKVPEVIDSNHELKAITQYVTKNWDGFDKVEAEPFFTRIWAICLDKTKEKFDQHAFTDFVKQWAEERKDYDNWSIAGTKISKEKFNQKIDEDRIKDLPFLILMETMTISSNLRKNWDYEKVLNEIVSKIKHEFPEASKLRPKGWKEMKKNYSDYDGQAEFDSKKAKEEFGGMDSGSAASHSFEVRVALPYVMYDDTNQDNKPLNVLIGAVLGHAYELNDRNNATLMLKEFLALKEKYDQPEYYCEPVKEIEFDFKVPLNKKLFTLINESNPNLIKGPFIKTNKDFADKHAKKLAKKKM